VSEAVHRLGFQTLYRIVAMISGANCFNSRNRARSMWTAMAGIGDGGIWGAVYRGGCRVGQQSPSLPRGFCTTLARWFWPEPARGPLRCWWAARRRKMRKPQMGENHVRVRSRENRRPRVLERWVLATLGCGQCQVSPYPERGVKAARMPLAFLWQTRSLHRLLDTPVGEPVSGCTAA